VPGCEPLTDVHDFLEQLAVIQPSREPQFLLDQLLPRAGEAFNVVFTARSRENLPRELWLYSHFIFAGH
jgi:hypothetical protein